MGMRSRALLLEGDAVVEGLRAIAALGDKMEADATNVFLGTEVLEVVYLVALYLEFHQAPVAQTDTVALAQMAVDDFRKPYFFCSRIKRMSCDFCSLSSSVDDITAATRASLSICLLIVVPSLRLGYNNSSGQTIVLDSS